MRACHPNSFEGAMLYIMNPSMLHVGRCVYCSLYCLTKASVACCIDCIVLYCIALHCIVLECILSFAGAFCFTPVCFGINYVVVGRNEHSGAGHGDDALPCFVYVAGMGWKWEVLYCTVCEAFIYLGLMERQYNSG
jgi:hypothetical protein